jgi:hypothetical protein
LIYGRDDTAVEVARRLSDTLDVTVLLSRPDAITPPSSDDFPVLRGTIRSAKGHLGDFELVVDDTAAALPSSRDRLIWGTPRDGAVSRCDIVIDLTGGTPLFPAHNLRPGYLRCDPERPELVERLILDASRLIGTFDKPAYIRFTENLCAHSRSRQIGCTRRHQCRGVCGLRLLRRGVPNRRCRLRPAATGSGDRADADDDRHLHLRRRPRSRGAAA